MDIAIITAVVFFIVGCIGYEIVERM